MSRADPDLSLNSMVLETIEYLDATLDLPVVLGFDGNDEVDHHLRKARSHLLQALAVTAADAVLNDGREMVEVPDEWTAGGFM